MAKEKKGRLGKKRIIIIIIAVIISCFIAGHSYNFISDYILINKSNDIAKEIEEKQVIIGIWYTDNPYKLKLKIQQNANELYLKIYGQLSGNIPLYPQHKIHTILHNQKANFEINKAFSIEKWEMRLENEKLHIVIDQHFTDNSGRPNGVLKFILKRRRSIFNQYLPNKSIHLTFSRRFALGKSR